MNILLGLIYFALAAICACLGKRIQGRAGYPLDQLRPQKLQIVAFYPARCRKMPRKHLAGDYKKSYFCISSK